MHVAVARVFEVAGDQVAVARYHLVADRTGALVGGVVRPAVGTAEHMHDAVVALFGEQFGPDRHPRRQFHRTDRAAAGADRLVVLHAAAVFDKTRVAVFLPAG